MSGRSGNRSACRGPSAAGNVAVESCRDRSAVTAADSFPPGAVGSTICSVSPGISRAAAGPENDDIAVPTPTASKTRQASAERDRTDIKLTFKSREIPESTFGHHASAGHLTLRIVGLDWPWRCRWGDSGIKRQHHSHVFMFHVVTVQHEGAFECPEIH